MMKLRKTIKRIQKSDEGVRQKWLWLLTIVCGLFIILFWLAYINTVISQIGAAETSPNNSFFAVFGAGLLSIREQTVDGLSFLLEEKSYDIEMPVRTFVYNELEPAVKVSLP